MRFGVKIVEGLPVKRSSAKGLKGNVFWCERFLGQFSFGESYNLWWATNL